MFPNCLEYEYFSYSEACSHPAALQGLTEATGFPDAESRYNNQIPVSVTASQRTARARPPDVLFQRETSGVTTEADLERQQAVEEGRRKGEDGSCQLAAVLNRSLKC